MKNTQKNIRKEKFSKVALFTKKIKLKFGGLIKSIVVFGSIVKSDKPIKEKSDIDIWIMLDDTDEKLSKSKEEIESNIKLTAMEIGDLHVQIHYITQFWKWLRQGDPVLFNFLRFGYPIYDSGFIKPAQRLLKLGMIPPSEETILMYSKSAQEQIKKAEECQKIGIISLYNSMVCISQAVSMKILKHRPDPSEISGILKKLYDSNYIQQEYVDYYENIYNIWKKIDHNELKNVTVELFEEEYKKAKKFVLNMQKILDKTSKK